MAAALIALTAMVAVVPASAASASAQLQSVLHAQASVDAAAAHSQKRINNLTDKTEDAAARYAKVLAKAKSFEQYNQKLSQQVKSQLGEITSLQKQLDGIQNTAREIKPLMENMVQSLAKFVKLDLPFLPQEREQRVQKLASLLPRADVSISAKYRQILQAYMIELEYGHTIGTYKGTLGSGKNARAVQFVRIGRVTLMYQSLDGSTTGYWNADKKQWVVDNGYADAFDAALKMANKRGAPELLTVPVPVPKGVQS